MNVGEAFKRTMGLLDEYSVNGTLRTSAENADYRLIFNRILDRVQKDMATVNKIPAKTQINRYPFENLLGKDVGFDLIQHLNSDITTVSSVGARAYYFETDGTNEVDKITIEEETSTDVWTSLGVVSGTSTLTEFTGFKGTITASSTANNIRLNFSGNYPYKIRNTALWTTLWASSTQVPDYKEYVKYTMPTDFYELDNIVFEDGQFRQDFSDYYWENPITLCVNYSYQGSFTIFYHKYPTDISSDDTTPTLYDSTELELTIPAQEILIYGCAAELLLTDPTKKGTGVLLQNMYGAKRAEFNNKVLVPVYETINEVNGW